MLVFYTLFYKEIIRFLKVSFQTVAAPILTAVLYLVIFGQVLEDNLHVYNKISYSSFLVPGLAMMSILQNAFANPASSLIQSKITGNIIFVLLAPISKHQLFFGYTLAGAFRGCVVGLGVLLATVWFIDIPIHNILWILIFSIISSWILSIIGLIAGILVEKFDQLATFQNFLIMPATMLAGVFYSVEKMPYYAKVLAHINPFFFMVDGFRYGFIGISDVNVYISLGVSLFTLAILYLICMPLINRLYNK